ncbi:MAG: hypothetical protein P8L32_02315 [Paracoccaceae bacterium]|nr:hypothetical protein [Paracoccaceae bacterium]
MAGPVAVSLHLGAHKTASTHLQKSLDQNGGLLKENDVRYFGPKYLRHKDHAFLDLFGLRPDGVSIGNRDGSTQIEWLAKGARRIVLSDENILGPVFDQLNPGVLYPQADIRVESFIKTVGEHPVSIFLATREPSSWIASLYSQRVVGGESRSFKKFVGTNQPHALRWSNLIDRLRRIPSIAGLYLWRKEDYPDVAAPVLRRMIGWRLGPLVGRIDGRVNEGLSAAAIEKLLEWNTEYPKSEARSWVKEARELLPISAENGPFDPWTEPDKLKSRTAYSEDIERIRKWDDVEVIKPSQRSRG